MNSKARILSWGSVAAGVGALGTILLSRFDGVWTFWAGVLLIATAFGILTGLIMSDR